MDNVREANLLREKFKYHAELEEKYNTTGFSMMELNDSLEGLKIAKRISRLIAADMIERFGE